MRIFAAGMGVLAAMVTFGFGLSRAQTAHAAWAAYCASGVGRQDARRVPAELAPAVAGTFDVSVEVVRKEGAFYVRCAGRKLLACWVGANLNCGKADRRRRLPGAAAFCHAHPGSKIVPMAATGHATIYAWRCVGPRAVAGKIMAPVDAQGFIAANWRSVP